MGGTRSRARAWIMTGQIAMTSALLVVALLLGRSFVAMLQHVFDPPPDHLAVPWAFLLGLGGAALAGGLVAAALAALQIRRLPLGAILREQ